MHKATKYAPLNPVFVITRAILVACIAYPLCLFFYLQGMQVGYDMANGSGQFAPTQTISVSQTQPMESNPLPLRMLPTN